jgi:DNA-binding NarL/FixJ family response regulator
MIKILIVDDHPVVVEGLKKVLQNYDCQAAFNGKEALVAVLQFKPDLVLLDINLPDINGIELCKTLTTQNKRLKILAISYFNQRSYVSRMIENGAKGYILKNSTEEEIRDAITDVLSGKEHYSDEIVDLLHKKNATEETFLTRRELEILRLIADGFTNSSIAEKLFVSPLTVDSHRKNLIMKLDAKNTASLIKIALSRGLIEFKDC